MINILCWKWKSDKDFRSQYSATHVNILYAMLKRNLTVPFILTCITDDPIGIDPEVQTMEIWDYPKVKLHPAKPNCYRRLRMFSAEAKELFGDKILSLDLDCVITSNIDHIVNKDVDFAAWYKNGVPYQGGLILHKTGTRQQLWDDFDPNVSPNLGKSRGFCGSDQAWISAKLPKGEAVFLPEKDGVYSYKAHIKNRPENIPANTCIIFFHGSPKNDDPHVLKHKFMQDHWRL